MWAYPREFGDADSASQITGSPNRFTPVSAYSHLFLLLSGYAVLDNPTMPIIGAGETANDTYIEQLVSDAQAAIDKVVDMGVGDRDRIGVGGHSYGAFMTANLLAHSRLFRAGFAESGAYNRSLTPFGFQSERRTFWEVPDLYAKMSPFWYANRSEEHTSELQSLTKLVCRLLLEKKKKKKSKQPIKKKKKRTKEKTEIKDNL